MSSSEVGIADEDDVMAESWNTSDNCDIEAANETTTEENCIKETDETEEVEAKVEEDCSDRPGQEALKNKTAYRGVVNRLALKDLQKLGDKHFPHRHMSWLYQKREREIDPANYSLCCIKR